MYLYKLLINDVKLVHSLTLSVTILNIFLNITTVTMKYKNFVLAETVWLLVQIVNFTCILCCFINSCKNVQNAI